jgi:DNA-3-methyladenine glycosylase I
VTALSDDGLVRCGWADAYQGTSSQLYRDYHDHEWGRSVHDGVALFERISLEAFQSGLSWLVILRKRENFRRAFSGFDIETVARYTDADVARLTADAGIVRNRAKIEATIANARVAADLGSQGLADLLWSFAPKQHPRPVNTAQIPSVSAESTAMANALKRRGFRFTGPTTAYALMQAVGMVDDHLQACWVPPAAAR